MSMSINALMRQIKHDNPDMLDFTAWQQARKEVMKRVQPLGEGWGKKEAILEALYRTNTNAGVGTDSLMEWLAALGIHTNRPELLGMLWDLQKQNLVTFKESHTRNGSELSRVRLTIPGRVKAAARRGDPPPSTTIRRKDRSGQPKVISKPHVPEVIPEVIPEVPAEKPREPLPQNMKTPLTDETGETYQASSISAQASSISAQAAQDAESDTHTQYSIDLTHFPLIRELLEKWDIKRAARDKAAKLVEAAAAVSDIDEEAAESLMARATEIEGDPLTPFELEVIRLGSLVAAVRQ